LYAIDRDPQAVAVAKEWQDPRFEIISGPFSSLYDYMAERDLLGKVDGLLLDLGVSSPQLDEAERGFSFMNDGPLDMRMDPLHGESAADWLLHADVDDIAWVLRTYGEERFANRIARAIVADRVTTPYTRTRQLAEMIARVVPNKEKHKHPATRSFQALRIHVNQELKEIEETLKASLSVLAPGGRLAVISFHSLEDRIVKQFIRQQEKGIQPPKGLPITEDQIRKTQTLHSVGKAIKPADSEVSDNVRSRSSVLRVAERLGN
jgi:16S rRNA (cytosine1402-N4)-methyltransferase